MFLVNKEDIPFYRYAVAKVCFLKVYPEYVLLEDMPKSNCMRVRMKENNGEFIVSLFSFPSIKLRENDRVICFYQSRYFEKAKQKYESEMISVYKLSNEFDAEYNMDFETAIKTPEKYYDNVGTYQFLFEYVLLRHNDTYGYDRKWYKYYTDEKVDNNRFGVVDGKISFADPQTFNDPFDVNCFFANNKDMSGLFRIFCVAPSPMEILMWSYYGADHRGYCFEYNENDILNEILKTKIDGLCIIGNVDYKNTRPPQKSKLNAISFTELNFYIQAAFTKFDEWSHEREFRFVMLSDSFANASSQYHVVQVPVCKIFCGLRGTGKPVSDSVGNSITPMRVSKDLIEYKLI